MQARTPRSPARTADADEPNVSKALACGADGLNPARPRWLPATVPMVTLGASISSARCHGRRWRECGGRASARRVRASAAICVRLLQRQRLAIQLARPVAVRSALHNPRQRDPSLFGAVRLSWVARDQTMGRDVLRHDRAAGEERVRADAAELMHADESAQHRKIVDDDVSGELRVVRKGRRVSDHAVMRDVAVGKQPVAVAKRRDAAVLRSAGVNGDEFADHVVIADDRQRRLAVVLAVLRNLADRGELENAVARSQARTPRSRRAALSSCLRR